MAKRLTKSRAGDFLTGLARDRDGLAPLIVLPF